jgi:hypothetical protein
MLLKALQLLVLRRLGPFGLAIALFGIWRRAAAAGRNGIRSRPRLPSRA